MAANFDDLNTQFPVYQILFAGAGENSPITIGFSSQASSGGPSSVDVKIQDFADAVAALWSTTVASVTRFDVDGTVL